MKIKKFKIKNRKTPNDLDYLFTKVQACKDDIVLEVRLLKKLIDELKKREISISETSVVSYLEERFTFINKNAEKVDFNYINENLLTKIKLKEKEIDESNKSEESNYDEENNKNLENKNDNKSSIFEDDYFNK